MVGDHSHQSSNAGNNLNQGSRGKQSPKNKGRDEPVDITDIYCPV